MKITFIATFYNEEKTIDKFLLSLLNQSKLPQEIILVDGASTDKTVHRINNFFSKKKGIQYKLIIKKGNIAAGRNAAIINARNKIIAVSDGGCLLEKDWLKNITRPLLENKNIDVVSGFYKPVCKNIFEKCLASYTSVMPDKIDPKNFLPSSRSIAFKKTAWEKVNGYPEYLDRCEDLIFAINLKKSGFNFYFTNQAIVYWPQRETLGAAFKQFFNYAVGDGMAMYFRPQVYLLFLRYIIIILFLVLFLLNPGVYFFSFMLSIFLLYVLWSISKNYRYVKNYRSFFWLPVLQVTSDIAVLLGTSIGFAQSIIRKK